MAKVLEGNYADKFGRKEIVPKWIERKPDAKERAAVQRLMNDPDLAERAEDLRQRLGGGCNG